MWSDPIVPLEIFLLPISSNLLTTRLVINILVTISVLCHPATFLSYLVLTSLNLNWASNSRALELDQISPQPSVPTTLIKTVICFWSMSAIFILRCKFSGKKASLFQFRLDSVSVTLRHLNCQALQSHRKSSEAKYSPFYSSAFLSQDILLLVPQV